MQTLKSRSKACRGEKWVPAKCQRDMVKWLVGRPEAALFADPGLRKTSCTLAAFLALRKAGGVHKALVIAPLRVCELVWSQDGEVGRWADFQHLRVSLLHGPDKNDALEVDADLYVVNPDGLAWLVTEGRLKDLQRRGVDLLVIDELAAFKHTKTKRFKTLRPWLGRFRRRWGLTGSPVANGLLDLFGQVYALDLGRSLGQFLTHYRHAYFLPTGFGGFEWKLQVGAEKKIYKRLKPLALSLRASDHLDLPKLVEQDLFVTLPPKAQKAYDDLEEELITYLDQGKVTAANAAVASGKCRQVTGGAVYADDNATLNGGTRRKVHHLHEAKVEALVELVDELQGAPLLICYEFQHEIERIRAALGDVPVINGQSKSADVLAAVKAWNTGGLKLLGGQPQAMSHGLNLQSGGCCHLCWFTLPWAQDIYAQANARLHRSGQKNRVIVHRLLARKTIDEVVARALTSKTRVQDALLDALKKRGSSTLTSPCTRSMLLR